MSWIITNPVEYNIVSDIINSAHGVLESDGTLPISSVPPTSPTKGQLYFDPTLGLFRIWDGAQWLNSGAATSGSADWLNGAGIPANALGIDGNLYYNTTSGTVYKKIAGAWVAQFSLARTNYFEYPFNDSTNITINHNLGTKPGGVRVLDSANTEWFGFKLTYTDLNNLVINCNNVFSGTVILS